MVYDDRRHLRKIQASSHFARVLPESLSPVLSSSRLSVALDIPYPVQAAGHRRQLPRYQRSQVPDLTI